MQTNVTPNVFRQSWVLSVFIHLLIFISFFSFLKSVPPEKKQKMPSLYIPSYTYTAPISSSFSSAKPTKTASNASTDSKVEDQVSSSPKPVTHAEMSVPKRSIMDISRDLIRQNEFSNAVSHLHDEEPILLIGDDTKIVNPLIKILAKALSAHFHYPKMEGNLGIRGKVLVKFIIHPDGYFSDAQIIESSENQNFNNAALYAVNTAPRALGVNRFLSEPRSFLVGFLFN